MSDKKFALITGGSEGVGFATAEMLVRENFLVGLVARDLAKLEAAREKLGAANVLLFSCDVTRAESIAELHVAVAATNHKINLLVNSAGTFRWDDGLEIDLILLNAESKKMMMEKFVDLLAPSAAIVNVSSQAALFASDDPRRAGEEQYVLSMQRVDEYSKIFQTAHPELNVYITHPPLMKGKISETQFRHRPGFEDIDFDNLPGPEIVAEEIRAYLTGI